MTSSHSMGYTSRRDMRRERKQRQRRNRRRGMVAGFAISAASLGGVATHLAASNDSETEAAAQGRVSHSLPAETLNADQASVTSAAADLAASSMGLSTVADSEEEAEGSVSVAGFAKEQEANTSQAARALPGNIVLNHPVASPRISSPFGHRNNPTGSGTQFHVGQDYPVPTGTKVAAAGDGVVTFAGVHSTGGNRLEIDHGNGVVTAYSHNSSLSVNVGDKVSAGQQIALAGSTGNSTGPHVHFEIMIDDKWVNPAIYLPPLGTTAQEGSTNVASTGN